MQLYAIYFIDPVTGIQYPCDRQGTILGAWEKPHVYETFNKAKAPLRRFIKAFINRLKLMKTHPLSNTTELTHAWQTVPPYKGCDYDEYITLTTYGDPKHECYHVIAMNVTPDFENIQ